MSAFANRLVLGETPKELSRRIQDVQACVAARPSELRSPELRPSLHEFPAGADLQAATATLCSQRRTLLSGSIRLSAHESGGRLLVCAYNLSLCSGESEHESAGFFDIDDRPPWNLWLVAGLVEASVVGTAEPTEILLAWVPRALVPRAQSGIAVNPYDCVFWGAEAPSPLRRALGGSSVLDKLETQAAV